jgi:hypothetical protein
MQSGSSSLKVGVEELSLPSYLIISKDPLTANTETSITSTATFTIPTELTTGISMSQRTLGQELSVEIVSSDTQNTPPGHKMVPICE